MFTLDTNALIYYLAGRTSLIAFIAERREALFFVPTVVVAEFLSYPALDRTTERLFEQFLNDVVIVNLDLTIAKRASSLRRTYRLKTIDAIVAASALETSTALVTYNAHDFKKIRELNIIAP